MRIKDEKTKELLLKISVLVICAIMVIALAVSYYRRSRRSGIELKSRYTFSVRINNEGDVIKDDDVADYQQEIKLSDFADMKVEDAAKIWINEYTKQFTNNYLPSYKAIKNIKINDIKVVDKASNTCLISFSAALKNNSSEYFSTWDGIMDNGRMQCEWVVSFSFIDHFDDTLSICVSSMLSPEDYGIAKYNQSIKGDVTGDAEKATSSNSSLTKYEIKNNTLLVSYDGGEKYQVVPVDVSNLAYVENSTSQLQKGSYILSNEKTAFLYGGTTSGSKKTPISVIFSNDKGGNWINCELDKIYDAGYLYVNFFDEKNGVVVCGYGLTGENQQSSRIYTTTDGGETWNTVGSGPANNVLKGVLYTDSNTGFFCYDYVNGMDSNLYITRDGGKTFSKVLFEEQELDSTAINSQTPTSSTTSSDGSGQQIKWSDVYKDAVVPIVDTSGVITVYLTQGASGTYNDGKTAAKYQSSDNGNTWKYISQLEVSLE